MIGGRAYCESCNSVGLIAKTGGPRRGLLRDAEMALDGDVVVCQCPYHQPVKSTLPNAGEYDDTDYGFLGLTAAPVLANYGSVFSPPMAAAKKVVDEHFEHAPEHEPTIEAICPNMTNKQFAVLVMELRDEAVVLVAERLQELERWDKVAHARIFEWFGNRGFLAANSHLNEMREYLRKGLSACDGVLRGLKPENFVRWSPTALKHVGCVSGSTSGLGIAAQVCKPDVKTHTIAMALEFCEMKRDRRVFGAKSIRDGDSQLLTLVHEVTHFNDTFGSTDDWYGTGNSKSKLLQTGDFAKARINADSLASYILGVDAEASA
ncbi:M35 family metallo-endopeptidase [Variovorax humicola]|uniref:M35 family metallo-endopeptidase n=1 Tax=Variovorax humicola TaxID=1769758 RepID=A0ABU8WCD5_9BURK